MYNNIIVTGLPRSGTTLTCHLLNKVPNTVALHEPMEVRELAKHKNHSLACDHIEAFFEQMRMSILKGKKAISKQVNGKVPDNPVGSKYSVSGLRASVASHTEIIIEKPLETNFTLIVKHPSAFTALLEVLVVRFPVYAVIRNPLSVLTSWNSVAFPVQNGHAPAAENLDFQLKKALAKIDDRIERQLYLLSWFFKRYEQLISHDSIIHYEKIVSSGGQALNVIVPGSNILNEKLENKNKNDLYDIKLMHCLGERLLKTDGAYWNFYSKESVEILLK
ncbi:MAG: hypothetical protein CV087_01785 [Candidatus Brocadia sp. WS118]|nr:MAG: hypothetical protein CV087_01785 [Candidatus Brocadia sp. WS118]